VLRDAMNVRSGLLGTKTIYVEGVGKVEIKNATETIWDIDKLEKGLRRAGMPDEVIGEIIVPTTEYKVNAVRAKQAAAANKKYERAIARAQTVREKLPTVSIG
jgi:hypothetical protein